MTRTQSSRLNRALQRLAILERDIESARNVAAQSVRPLPSTNSSSNRGRRRKRGRARKSTVSVGRGMMVRSAGSDMVTSIMIGKANAQPGVGLFLITLNPQHLKGTRLAAESKLWTRWRPIRMKFSVQTGASPLFGGRIGMGWTADPNDKIPEGIRGVTKLLSLRPSGDTTLSVPFSMEIPCSELPQKWLYCSGDELDSDFGAVVGLITAAISVPTDSDTAQFGINLKLDWVVEFSGPDLPEDLTGNAIQAPSDWTPYFSDSVSGWEDGKKLTFKHSEGGEVVPFDSAVPRAVYKCSSDIPYYDKNGAVKWASFGVRIQSNEYKVPGLALFTDEALAKKYALDGSTTGLIDYFKAGPYVTPDNPVWTMVALPPKVSSSSRYSYATSITPASPTASPPLVIRPNVEQSYVKL